MLYMRDSYDDLVHRKGSGASYLGPRSKGAREFPNKFYIKGLREPGNPLSILSFGV